MQYPHLKPDNHTHAFLSIQLERIRDIHLHVGFPVDIIGLMWLEGLWANTAFRGRKGLGKGFAVGYVYGSYMNPYKTER